MLPWLKRIAYIVLFTLCVLSIARIGVVAWVEHAKPFSGIPLPTCSSNLSDSRYLKTIERARNQVQATMVERHIPGLAVAVAVDGTVVWSEGFGYANRESRIQACPQTQFRIASVSKLVTAVAVAQLYEQGRLDLDAPIQHYVPEFPNHSGYVVTPRELAFHRSGIRHYLDDREALNQKHYNTVAESLEKFENDPLLFAPGANFHYSSYGYVLLSGAVEGASDETYLSYVQRHIFNPLHMLHTAAEKAGHPTTDQSQFYDDSTGDGDVMLAPYQDLSSKWGAGGFLSTAEDLVRFGSAHITEGFLRRETRNLTFTPASRQGGVLGYGMGWMVAHDLHLRQVYFHFGATSGGTAVLAIFPEEKASIALVANLGHARFEFARLMTIINLFLGEPVLPLSGTLIIFAVSVYVGVRHFFRRKHSS
ncbi:MAG: beta-lactamase family protein [Acidobacteria bacterium]|nr:beta-lactamase family protein [Acidobacteriota bacterium]